MASSGEVADCNQLNTPSPLPFQRCKRSDGGLYYLLQQHRVAKCQVMRFLDRFLNCIFYVCKTIDTQLKIKIVIMIKRLIKRILARAVLCYCRNMAKKHGGLRGRATTNFKVMKTRFLFSWDMYSNQNILNNIIFHLCQVRSARCHQVLHRVRLHL